VGLVTLLGRNASVLDRQLLKVRELRPLPSKQHRQGS
jgi:hypothetical protein